MTTLSSLSQSCAEFYTKAAPDLWQLTSDVVNPQSELWQQAAESTEFFFQRHASAFFLIGTTCVSICLMPKAFFAGTAFTWISCRALEHYTGALSLRRLERIVTVRDACFAALGTLLTGYVAYRYDTLNWAAKLLTLMGSGTAGYCLYKFSTRPRLIMDREIAREKESTLPPSVKTLLTVAEK